MSNFREARKGLQSLAQDESGPATTAGAAAKIDRLPTTHHTHYRLSAGRSRLNHRLSQQKP